MSVQYYIRSVDCHTIVEEIESTSTTSNSLLKQQSHRGVFVRDSIIGFADGLTVPFALTAGLSSLGSSKVVILGGLAELFAGSISMGLGAYLAAITERKHFQVAAKRQRQKIGKGVNVEEQAIYGIFEQYGVSRAASRGVMDGLRLNEDMWVQFVMDFELKLSNPSVRMAPLEGLVMGASYFLGGLLPMVPYFATRNISHALFASISITAVILVMFGFAKALITGTTHRDAAWSAVQTVTIGALAAAVSYGIVRGMNESRMM
ncbi:hypothetical protein DOTSEDRAFT_86825 [Dothistroma septosporum NZE10]|uniref:Uncharacterized protein n=1 Tax=Dothistroma septosporum (strain NZE10 / CBS 128990) TaxID=675120 RepID=N1PTD0_DOTSN|nr:hypothetical protein DOTSEDRAFT_86825 [Dothistroma septosporum NZE10]